MARRVIAEIQLAPGQIGFYDPLTNIYLTNTYPRCVVYSGMNTTRLQASVKSKRLMLLSGSLTNPISKEADIVQPSVSKPVEEETVKPIKKEEKPAINEEPITEPQVAEEPVKAKKKTTKKAKSEDTEVAKEKVE